MGTIAIETVGQLVAELLKENQAAPVRLKVCWAGDTATADVGEIDVEAVEGHVHVKGWMSNCDTSLEIVASKPEICDECGEVYPEDADSVAGAFHKDTCSLNPMNAV